MAIPWLAGLLATGCVEAGDSADELSWIVPEAAPAPSELDLDSAPSAVNLVISELPRLNGAPMFEVYDEVMSYADEQCPLISSDPEGGSLWDSRCTSSSGAYYSGFISQFRGMHGPNYEQNMRGEASVVLPDGRTFLIAGQANTSVNTEVREYSSNVVGVFSWSGEASETAILAEGWETSLSWTAAYSEQNEILRFSAAGNVALPEGTITAVAFDEAKFNNDHGIGCTDEPAGEMALRDEAGTWHSLVFDVTANEDGSLEVADGECDGCGTVWDNGVEVGALCVDLSALFLTGYPPW